MQALLATSTEAAMAYSAPLPAILPLLHVEPDGAAYRHGGQGSQAWQHAMVPAWLVTQQQPDTAAALPAAATDAGSNQDITPTPSASACPGMDEVAASQPKQVAQQPVPGQMLTSAGAGPIWAAHPHQRQEAEEQVAPWEPQGTAIVSELPKLAAALPRPAPMVCKVCLWSQWTHMGDAGSRAALGWLSHGDMLMASCCRFSLIWRQQGCIFLPNARMRIVLSTVEAAHTVMKLLLQYGWQQSAPC